jgi:NADH-quinone oxidoreductase subunit M
MNQLLLSRHLLSLVLWTPIASLAVLLFLPSHNKNLIRIWANVATFAGFLISLPLAARFRTDLAGFQFVERADWIPSLGGATLSASMASACCCFCSRHW